MWAEIKMHQSAQFEDYWDSEIDFALTTDAPKEPAELVIHDGEDAEAFATRQRDFMSIM
jgi:hypothetical protein